MKNLANVLSPETLELSSELTADEVINELCEIIDVEKIANIENCKVEDFEMKFTQDDFYENGTISDKKVILDFFVNNHNWGSVVVDFSEGIIKFENL